MNGTNSDRAYDYVRKNILNGNFPPGHALQTNDLAREIGVSRTPVRDALRQLEADGLVVIQNGLGAKVRTMGEREFKELCELRLALEGYAAGLAARNKTQSDLEQIEAALRSVEATTEQITRLNDADSQFSELLHADVRFHVAIISAAKNDTIKSEILRLHVVNRVMAQPVPIKRERESWIATLKDTLESHTAIFEAIKSGNENAARARMEEHIQDIIDERARGSSQTKTSVLRELTSEELSYMALMPA